MEIFITITVSVVAILLATFIGWLIKKIWLRFTKKIGISFSFERPNEINKINMKLKIWNLVEKVIEMKLEYSPNLIGTILITKPILEKERRINENELLPFLPNQAGRNITFVLKADVPIKEINNKLLINFLDASNRKLGSIRKPITKKILTLYQTLQKEASKPNFAIIESFPIDGQRINIKDLENIYLKFNNPIDKSTVNYIGNYYVQDNCFCQWNICGWIQFAENDTKLIWHIHKKELSNKEIFIPLTVYHKIEIHIGRTSEWRVKDIYGNELPETIIKVYIV